MTEIQQSLLYGEYMSKLKWSVETIDGVQVFFRRFPLTGSMMKIHRPEKLPKIPPLLSVLKKNHIGTLVIEPVASQNQKALNRWCAEISKHIKLYHGTPFLPTKTIHIDLTPSEADIFQRFSEAKRRAVRRAIALGVTAQESHDIHALIRLKNKSAGLFGFITTSGLSRLWETFAPDNATILLAYSSHSSPVAGVLLMFWSRTAYYWIAGATHEGKKLFAPTLLVWEALKLSKKRANKSFDLIGVWDERKPQQNRDWFGFTRFKEGFGGTPFYYPLASQNI